MIRARFKANRIDYRPVKWPYPHPYWCSGYGERYSILIAYADNNAQIIEYWPEAKNIDAEECSEYTFSDRFPKPKWFEELEEATP